MLLGIKNFDWFSHPSTPNDEIEVSCAECDDSNKKEFEIRTMQIVLCGGIFQHMTSTNQTPKNR